VGDEWMTSDTRLRMYQYALADDLNARARRVDRINKTRQELEEIDQRIAKARAVIAEIEETRG
jgi:hypothetical protein